MNWDEQHKSPERTVSDLLLIQMRQRAAVCSFLQQRAPHYFLKPTIPPFLLLEPTRTKELIKKRKSPTTEFKNIPIIDIFEPYQIAFVTTQATAEQAIGEDS
jgi:hypothetical protein